MPLFRIKNGNCEQVRTIKFKAEEKGLQEFVEKNLQEIW
jgi:hypothetical protein